MKVWITKYALTSGVVEKDATVVEGSPKMISVKEGSYVVHYHKPHWHTTAAKADAQVAAMITAKIKSLRKSLAKMLSLQDQYKNAATSETRG